MLGCGVGVVEVRAAGFDLIHDCLEAFEAGGPGVGGNEMGDLERFDHFHFGLLLTLFLLATQKLAPFHSSAGRRSNEPTLIFGPEIPPVESASRNRRQTR